MDSIMGDIRVCASSVNLYARNSRCPDMTEWVYDSKEQGLATVLFNYEIKALHTLWGKKRRIPHLTGSLATSQ